MDAVENSHMLQPVFIVLSGIAPRHFYIFCYFFMASNLNFFITSIFPRNFGWHLLGTSLSHPVLGTTSHWLFIASMPMLILIHYESGHKEELQMDRLPLASGFIMERYFNAVERITPATHIWAAASIWSKAIKLKIYAAYTYYSANLYPKTPCALFYFHERIYSQKYIITVRLRVAAI